jgi:hypothetical protein
VQLHIAKCPKGTVGDIQLETILTPLLFPRTKPSRIWSHTIHDTQPNLYILDAGCGWGRLLAGLLSFPRYITKHLHYTGCEPTQSDVEQSKKRISELEESLLGQDKFSDYFLGTDLDTWDNLKKGGREFDFIYLINVLHHVKPSEIPHLFSDIMTLTKDGGYLVIHDFFFGEPEAEFDLSKYCDNCVFFGPNHVSAFFAMASTQTGLYRKMRRTSQNGKVYDLFTFILNFANELSKSQYENSVWYDDYFSYLDIPAALDISLSDILAMPKVLGNVEWFSRYHAYVASCHSDLRQKWQRAIDDYPLPFRRRAEEQIKQR